MTCAHLATTVTLHSPRVIGVFATATPPIVGGSGDCWSNCRGFAVANIVAFRDGGFIYFTKSEDLGRAVTKRCVTLGRFLGLEHKNKHTQSRDADCDHGFQIVNKPEPRFQIRDRNLAFPAGSDRFYLL